MAATKVLLDVADLAADSEVAWVVVVVVEEEAVKSMSPTFVTFILPHVKIKLGFSVDFDTSFPTR